MELKSGDVVRTGAGARAYLMLAEGSRVKLGEGASFSFHTRSLRPEKSFRGALDVLAGAFRFTTGKFAKARSREVSIRVGTATIGIRGTDVWGKTDKDGDLVALLEGRIDITRAGQVTEMGAGHELLRRTVGQGRRGQATGYGNVRQAGAADRHPCRRRRVGRKGKWRVLAGSAGDEAAALEIYDQARDAGFAARIKPREAEAEAWSYDVVLTGFASAAEAEVAAARLKAATELKPRVMR
jgi:hypothetical protein